MRFFIMLIVLVSQGTLYKYNPMCYRRFYHQYILMRQSLSFPVLRYAYFPVLYCHDLSLCFADLLKFHLIF